MLHKIDKMGNEYSHGFKCSMWCMYSKESHMHNTWILISKSREMTIMVYPEGKYVKRNDDYGISRR